MIERFSYPKNLIAVEKDIQKLPHVIFQKDRSLIRRADIICFGDGIHTDYELFPLLIIECKAGPITDKARMQLIGYNLIVKAPFVALANKKDVETGWYDPESKKYKFVPFLPKYQDLIGVSSET